MSPYPNQHNHVRHCGMNFSRAVHSSEPGCATFAVSVALAKTVWTPKRRAILAACPVTIHASGPPPLPRKHHAARSNDA